MTADVVVLVEEESSAIVVRAIARKLNVASRTRVFQHQGLGDLRESIPRKIAAFSASTYIVLCDADNESCEGRKRILAGLAPREARRRVIVRIACQELEAWYLAQPAALDAAGVLKKPLSKTLRSRNPDTIDDPKSVFRRHAHQEGQRINAQKICNHLDPLETRSRSFAHFVRSLRDATRT